MSLAISPVHGNEQHKKIVYIEVVVQVTEDSAFKHVSMECKDNCAMQAEIISISLV